ncbi:unannotated protein [freshwater metagenome]|uniref:Unannotated protein n=1 Tax=freshwater metagenome TaxID=449393 RepID=A0A6J6LH40_9ZZZZ
MIEKPVFSREQLGMSVFTRRQFLKFSGVAATSAAILSVDDVAHAATTRPLPLGTPILVVLSLYGGNDGLNTVIPFKDSIYYASRPGITYKPETLLPISDDLALNPSMSGIKSLWDTQKVAIVRGVGYPKPDRSHFSSMAIWQSGSSQSSRDTGWLGRWLDTQPLDPMSAISLGSVLPPMLVGKKQSGSALPLGGLNVPSGVIGAACARLSVPSPTDNPLMAAAATSMRNLFSVSSSVTPILAKPAPVAQDLPTAAGGNAGGDTNLAQQLNVVAKLIAAGAPTKVWSVSLGGFDTHANEANAQSLLLGAVSTSVTTFLSQLKASGRAKDVTVLIYSEFGRRVKANGSEGTDHGTAGPVFLVGDRVQGGFYGDQPSLTQLVDGDLAVTTDFRDIYATILEKVLMTPAEKVLGVWKGRTNAIKS